MASYKTKYFSFKTNASLAKSKSEKSSCFKNSSEFTKLNKLDEKDKDDKSSSLRTSTFSSSSNPSSYTSSKVSVNKNFIKPVEEPQVSNINKMVPINSVRRRSNINAILKIIDTQKFDKKSRLKRETKSLLGHKSFVNMLNDLKIKHKINKISRNYMSKKTLLKSTTKDLSILGNINKGCIKRSKKKTTSINCNFKKLDSSFDINYIKRQNTEQKIKKGVNKIRRRNRLNKMNKRYRFSISNFSKVSIQKEINNTDLKLATLVIKSPSMIRRRSSFLSRLPEALKKSLQVGVSKNPTRFSILSILQNEEDKNVSKEKTELTSDINSKSANRMIIEYSMLSILF